jgi:hypothetical protein
MIKLFFDAYMRYRAYKIERAIRHLKRKLKEA